MARSNRALAIADRPVRVALESPWQGYIPDLSSAVAKPNGLESSKSLVVHGGQLHLDHGWRKLGASTLPLGHDSTALGFTDSAAATYGAGKVTASAAQAQPVRFLIAFQRFQTGAGAAELEALAITADKGGAAGANQETGHVFRRGTAGTWSSVEFRARNGVGGITASSVPLAGGINDWVDGTIYPLGVTGFAVGAATAFAVAEAVFIFTNYVDQVMYFPDGTGTTNYSDFRSYSTQLGAVGSDATTDYYSGNATKFLSFRAKSVSTFDGKVWYFNTVEDSSYYAVRLRRSIVGNPFILWSGFEIEDALGPTRVNGIGAGYIDLDRFKTPGQRILSLGDVLACYSKDGVAFVRSTGSDVIPYAVQYVTLDRGLLSPGAVVPIGPASHFAILTDGWYIINSNGTLQEVGTTSPGTILSGPKEANYKWKEEFYTNLNETAINNGHLQVGYDPDEQYVRISIPFGTGTAYVDAAAASHPTASVVWIYDIRNDRVFQDDYSEVAGRDQTALCWSNINQEVGSAVSWAEVTAGGAAPWNALTDPGSWASLSPSFGSALPGHGDRHGYVYVHDDNLSTRDGEMVSWDFTTTPHDLGLTGGYQVVLNRVDVTYKNIESEGIGDASITVYGYDVDSGGATTASSQESAIIDLSRGQPGEVAQDYAHFKIVGDHIKVAMAGRGAVQLHSIDLEVRPLEGRYRRREGT